MTHPVEHGLSQGETSHPQGESLAGPLWGMEAGRHWGHRSSPHGRARSAWCLCPGVTGQTHGLCLVGGREVISGCPGLTALPPQIIAAQEEMLRKERELEEARKKLAMIRQQQYKFLPSELRDEGQH